MRRDLALRGALVGGVAACAGLATDALARPGSGFAVLLLSLAVIIAGAILGWLALLRPTIAVRRVALAAGRVAEGELGQRVSVDGGPVSDLTHSFNVICLLYTSDAADE